jgi:hypothetical protein
MMPTMISMKLGIVLTPAIGWSMCFFIGSIMWGGAFALFNSQLPSESQIIKGLL